MENTLRGVFADNLTTLLNLKEETSVSAARRSQINQKTIWNYCYSPTCNPTLNNVEAIADAFKIAPYRFLLAESFTHNASQIDIIEQIIGNIRKLSEREIEHISELVELLASKAVNSPKTTPP